MKIILGLAGTIGSGKGSAAEHLIKKHSANIHRTSKMLRDLLGRLYIETSRDHMSTLSTLLRQMFGEDIMSKVIYEDVKNDESEIVAVDGVRLLADVAYLKTFPEFKLVYIETDLKTRYERIVKRHQNPDERDKTFEEFENDQKAEAESQIEDLKKVADYSIENNGTPEEFFAKIDKLVEELKG